MDLGGPPGPFDIPLTTLRRRSSIKWREAPGDVLPLWVAEMDAMLAAPIVEVLHEAVDTGDTGYPGGTAYQEALSRFAAERWGWSFDPGQAALVPDVMMGAVEILKLVSPPGSGVVVTPPVYPPFYSFLEHMGRRIVEAPLDPAGRLDLGTLEAAFRGQGVAALLLANPHNPTGAVHTRAELTELAALAGRFGVRVVADEIHAPLVLEGARFTPYLSVPGTDDAFSLMSASKGWNLAGLKAALAIAGPTSLSDLARMPEEVSHGPSHLGVLAHTAAFGHGGEWLDRLLSALAANRALLGRLLDEHMPGTAWVPPEGTYLAWLDCRALGLDGARGGDGGGHHDAAGARGNVHASAGPAAAFLREGRVLLSSGPAFGTGGDGFVRLNFATSPTILTEAVRRMGSVAVRS